MNKINAWLPTGDVNLKIFSPLTELTSSDNKYLPEISVIRILVLFPCSKRNLKLNESEFGLGYNKVDIYCESITSSLMFKDWSPTVIYAVFVSVLEPFVFVETKVTS